MYVETTPNIEISSSAEYLWSRVGTTGRSRDTCGKWQSWAHHASDGDTHYRQSATVCGAVWCSEPACRASWARREAEAIEARIDRFMAQRGEEEGWRGSWVLWPDDPNEDPERFRKAIPKHSGPSGGAVIVHLEPCPRVRRGLHAHVWGVGDRIPNTEDGGYGAVHHHRETPSEADSAHLIEDLDEAWHRVKALLPVQSTVHDGDPTLIPEVKAKHAVTWFGCMGYRNANKGSGVPSGKQIGKEIRLKPECPVCHEVPDVWFRVQWFNGTPNAEHGVLDHKMGQVITPRAWWDQ
jgi:hypothetical protein